MWSGRRSEVDLDDLFDVGRPSALDHRSCQQKSGIEIAKLRSSWEGASFYLEILETAALYIIYL
jgi:hypothetical protein